MTEGLWAAIIGVGGTLVGTALGWWLNTLSNRGKIDIFCKKWDVEFETNINGVLARTEDIEKAEYFDFNVEAEYLDKYHLSLKDYPGIDWEKLRVSSALKIKAKVNINDTEIILVIIFNIDFINNT